jgi:hypothetical protein
VRPKAQRETSARGQDTSTQIYLADISTVAYDAVLHEDNCILPAPLPRFRRAHSPPSPGQRPVVIQESTHP